MANEPKVKAVHLTNTVTLPTAYTTPKVKAIHFVNEVVVTRLVSNTTLASAATIN